MVPYLSFFFPKYLLETHTHTYTRTHVHTQMHISKNNFNGNEPALAATVQPNWFRPFQEFQANERILMVNSAISLYCLLISSADKGEGGGE